MTNFLGPESERDPVQIRTDGAQIRSATLELVRQLIPSAVMRFLAYLSFWTIVAFASALHWWYYPQGNYPYTWWQLFLGKAAVWYTWGAIAPLVSWLGYKFRLDAGARLKRALTLTTLATIVTLAYLAAYTQLVLLVTGTNSEPEAFANMFRFVVSMHSTYYFLAFWVVVAVEHIVANYNRYLERERLTSELKSRLAQAQLERLKNQLQPHFLFNALNTISSLVVSDKKSEAYDTLADLAELLRISLDRNDSEFVSLADELEFSKLYADVMSRRFPDQLVVLWDVNADSLDAEIPNMILQPLIENAIKYGIDAKANREPITLTAATADGQLRITIENSLGSDSETAGIEGHGIGLSQLRQRLDYHYGELQQLSVESDNDRFCVSLKIPYKKIQVAERIGTKSNKTTARSNR